MAAASRSGPKTKNRYIQRHCGAYRVEVFPQECDLSVRSAQEHHIILAIGSACCLDEPFALDLGGGSLRIGKWIHLQIEEAEVLHGADEPGRVTDHFLATRKSRRMAERGRISELPQDGIGEQRLPSGVVVDERLDVQVQ